MKLHKTNRIETKPSASQQPTAEIDRILAAEEALIPSSGFVSTVMDRVREQAAAPPPIPFPWKRGLPGFLLAAGVFAWGGYELVTLSLAALRSSSLALTLALPPADAALARPAEQAGWVALSLGLSLAAWLFSRRLAGRGGLL